MNNEELNKIIMRSEHEHERLKDTVHEQYNKIKYLEDLYNQALKDYDEAIKENERLNSIKSMKEDLLKIIGTYGINKQLKYIHSEYFELDEAILNCINEECGYYEEVENYHKKHIAEEIADVMVMLKQFQYYYDIEDSEIEKIMVEKINRQLTRIEEEKE